MAATHWDEIAGVGPARKNALLAYFGSARAISRTAVADLMALDGINERLAQKI